MEWRQKTGREKGGEKEIKPHAEIYMDKVNINLERRGAKEVEVEIGANMEERLEDTQRRDQCILSNVHVTGD